MTGISRSGSIAEIHGLGGKALSMILTADIGNTRTTLIAHPAELPPWDQRPRHTFADRGKGLASQQERLADWIARCDGGEEESLLLHSAVAPHRSEELIRMLRELGIERVVPAGSAECPLDVANLCRAPDRVGRDRLLAASQARAHFGGGAAVVVDAGTAITVDAVDDTGGFRGGAIAVGPRTASIALHEATAALPAIDMHTVPEELGRDTESALALALFHGTAGMVDRLVEIVGRSLGDYRVLLCGGHASVLSAALKTPHEREREVIHLALWRLWGRAHA